MWTLEDIYREERAGEGPMVVPPQVDGGFLEDCRWWEATADIGRLLREFSRYRKEARRNPGEMVSGNPILGAPADPYLQPSEAAMRLSEIDVPALLPLISGAWSRLRILPRRCGTRRRGNTAHRR